MGGLRFTVVVLVLLLISFNLEVYFGGLTGSLTVFSKGLSPLFNKKDY